MEYLWDLYSEAGIHTPNEDAILAERGTNALLFAVADGVGSSRYGKEASALVIAALRNSFRRMDSALDLCDAVTEANWLLLEQNRASSGGYETTIAAALVMKEKTILLHAGDSRIYLFTGGQIIYQSEDHSAAQMAVRLGVLPPENLRSSPDRTRLIKALGISENLKPDLAMLPQFEAMLLCTDGFWGCITEEEMLHTLQTAASPKDWLGAMRGIHSQHPESGMDNHTALAVMQKENRT